jgi:4-nitrophenyl phosphatase
VGSDAGSVGLSGIEGVIADMDGVLWRGEQALPGLGEFFAYLRGRRIPFVLATNNSARSQAEYAEKLGRLGVPGVAETEIVTSRMVLVAQLKARLPAGRAVYVIGSPGLAAAVEAAGFIRTEKTAEAVVVGIDRAFSYDKLAAATRLLAAGAAFLATNADTTLPEGDGLLPGTGSLLAAISAASGRFPEVMGKPSPPMFAHALARLGTAPERTLMLGDRLDTDIEGARRAGLAAALVRSGFSTRQDAERSGFSAGAIIADLPELLAAWRS